MQTRDDSGIAVGLSTATGQRPRNEDFACCHVGTREEQARHGVVAAIADGMGGARGGRVAAEVAVRSFIDAYTSSSEILAIPRVCGQVVDAINRWLHWTGRTDPELQGMACTFTALILRGRHTHLVHVGDTRIYRLRNDQLTLLTTDHTLGRPGTSHVLTRALGANESVRIDHSTEPAREHDRYVLMSDGVHTALSSSQILHILSARAAPQETAQRLVNASLEARTPDNATALVVDVLQLPATSQSDLESALAGRPLLPVPLVGAVVDDFQLDAMLADGSYSRVFRATDRVEQRSVIIKFPKPVVAVDRLARAAFLREMWIAGRVRSPFVGEVFDLSPERSSGLYVVMPYYAGETLEQRLRRAPQMPLAAGVSIAIKLAKAVAALHRAGIIHRDIKPDNVILEQGGGLKLVDFGVARIPGVEDGAPEEAPGTPSYVPPEVFGGAPAGERADMFALGVTLYRMFANGAYPYGEIEPFSRPRFVKPKPLSVYRPDLPAWLERAIGRAVAIHPQERFADAIEIAFELERGSLWAAPARTGRVPLYERNPVMFWQVISAALLLALLTALAFLAAD
jgi:serine/threonine protein phosphatase PrpC